MNDTTLCTDGWYGVEDIDLINCMNDDDPYGQFGTIELDGNSLNGTLPTEIGYLDTIGEFGFRENNGLTSAIPTEVILPP